MTEERMSEEMLPCPLCGSDNVDVDMHPTFAATIERHIVCHECRLRLPANHQEGPRVATWNTRHPIKESR